MSIERHNCGIGKRGRRLATFGQFMAHDINLECLCGNGSTDNPFLFQCEDSAKFLRVWTEQTSSEMLGIAIIGDPRNDSHILISQLRLALINALSAFVDKARLTGVANDRVSDEGALAVAMALPIDCS